MKKYKKYEPKHDIYEIIEHYDVGNDTFIIPKIQEKAEEQQKVKTRF